MIRLTKKDLKNASLTLASAFKEEPHLLYYFPQDIYKYSHILEFFRFRLKFGILYGEVYVSSNKYEGVVIWIPSYNREITFLRIIRSGGIRLLFKCGIKSILRMLNIGDVTSKLYSIYGKPLFMILSTIGVAPEYQGKGIAKYLINSILTKLDKEKLPCFLETITENNVRIYQKLGFKVLEKRIIPKTQMYLWLMFRNFL